MISIEQQLAERGLPPEDITFIVDHYEEAHAAEVRGQAARLLGVIFLRVERDSAAGCALRRALGFSGGVSLARAARDFCVSKQYLDDLQAELEAKLGSLAFIARAARADDEAAKNLTGPPEQ